MGSSTSKKKNDGTTTITNTHTSFSPFTPSVKTKPEKSSMLVPYPMPEVETESLHEYWCWDAENKSKGIQLSTDNKTAKCVGNAYHNVKASNPIPRFGVHSFKLEFMDTSSDYVLWDFGLSTREFDAKKDNSLFLSNSLGSGISYRYQAASKKIEMTVDFVSNCLTYYSGTEENRMAVGRLQIHNRFTEQEPLWVTFSFYNPGTVRILE